MKNSVFEAQAGLRARYKETPAAAQVVNHVVTGGTDPNDPFHVQVRAKDPGGRALAVGSHQAVGGPYDAPCPSDLLCAALAACQDSSLRMVANLMGIELVALEVQVRGLLDVRGALGMQKDVPVGFQSLTVDVHLQAREGTPPEQLDKLRVAAERCCVVAQTLRAVPVVETRYHG